MAGTTGERDDRLTAARDEIAESRDAIGATLDALQGQMEPAHLAHRVVNAAASAAVDGVGEAAGRTGEAVENFTEALVGAVRMNPFPALALGAGLLWLWLRPRR